MKSEDTEGALVLKWNARHAEIRTNFTLNT